MKFFYCRRHDLAFCEKHKNQCFEEEKCLYTDNSAARFCCVCTGRYIPPTLDEALQAGNVNLYKDNGHG